jgi:hypothetical protein
MIATAQAFATTAAGFLLVAAILLPVAGALLSFALGGRHTERIAFGLMPVGLGVVVTVAVLVSRSGEPLVYILGIGLRAE